MFWINCLYWGVIVSVIAGAVWIGRRNRDLLQGDEINASVLRSILSPNCMGDEGIKPSLVSDILFPDTAVSQRPEPEIDPLAEEIYQAALKAGMITLPPEEKKPKPQQEQKLEIEKTLHAIKKTRQKVEDLHQKVDPKQSPHVESYPSPPRSAFFELQDLIMERITEGERKREQERLAELKVKADLDEFLNGLSFMKPTDPIKTKDLRESWVVKDSDL